MKYGEIVMKKTIISCLIVLLSFMLVSTKVQAFSFNNYSYTLLADAERDEFDSTCADFSPVLRMGGYVIFLVKIVLPLIIIVKSSLDLYKIVVSGNPDDLKKQANKLVMTLIVGAVIFYIPTIISVVFNFIDDYKNQMTERSDAYICKQCVFEPFSDTCSNAVKNANK